MAADGGSRVPQGILGDVLHRHASVHRLLTWRDATTAPLYLGAGLLAVLLALVPWDLVVPFCVRWGARVLGLLLLGPHMWYVGNLVEKLEREKKQAEAAAKAKAAKERRQGLASLSSSAPPAPDGAKAEDDVEEAYVVEVESFRSVPRQPCLPDVDCAHSFQPLR